MQAVIVKQTIQELAHYAGSIEPKTFQDIIASDSPSFRMIGMQHGTGQLTTILAVELGKICQLLAFKVSTDMITECAKNIADEFWYCKLDDIKLFKTYLFRNKLPVEMYRNDALVLYRLFEEYDILRHREFSNESAKRRKAEAEAEIVPNGKDVPMPEWVKENLKKLEAKVDERKKAFDKAVDEVLPEKKEAVIANAKAAQEAMEWMTCVHTMIDKSEYQECTKCGCIVYK